MEPIQQSCQFKDMPVIEKRSAKTTYPTGNKNFAVLQAFPSGFNEKETDPFLMCDEFGPTVSEGIEQNPDSFPVGWHPHRGMDIVTYLRKGVGRHADSMGNRGTFASPGMQWISVGSGIEHAEGGGTAKGEIQHGFQIWVNVPKEKKMEDPRYGTEPPENIPVLQQPGVLARILAGDVNGLHGPFETVQQVQIIDLSLEPAATFTHFLPEALNTCILYVFEGQGSIGTQNVKAGNVVKMNAALSDSRNIQFASSSTDSNFSIMIFAGKRLDEPISWRGPFVMNTQEEIGQAMTEYSLGTFLKKRAPWNYKSIAAFPK